MFSSRKSAAPAAAGGYTIAKSLRFRSSASAYLNRSMSAGTSTQKGTQSFWIKRGTLAVNQNAGLCAEATTYPANGAFNAVLFSSGDILQILCWNGSSYDIDLETTQVFRDPSAWYHIVIAWDTTQATASNRVKLYVNGSQVTSFGVATYPSQNTNLTGWGASNNYTIGTDKNNSNVFVRFFDGYYAEFIYVDGQALTPTSFGATDAATGVWQPIAYTGTYGTNGFYLKFTDTTSTSTLGNDSSGNSNTWTVNNISLTSGATYDSMKDVPTLTDADTANYCVLNPLQKDASLTVLDGNLRAYGTGGTNRNIFSTLALPQNQKIYFEANVVTGTSAGNYFTVGIAPSTLSLNTEVGTVANTYGIDSDQASEAIKRIAGVSTGYGAGTQYATGNVVQIAIDQANGKIWFGKNNTWFDSGDPAAGTNAAGTSLSATSEYFVVASFYESTPVLSFNFGQQPFAYTPPSGFKALNTFNLPTPTIGATASTQANKYFDVTTYTGTGSSQSITNSGSMQPDFVWIKGRSGATDHGLYDAVRGVQIQLESNNTDAETTETTGLTAFNSNGFTVGALAQLNTSSATYVGWQWKANGAGSSNTAGSITSTVSANTSAGFSIVTYTGTGANATVGHGLGVAPSFYVVKGRNLVTDWHCWHTSLGGGTYYIKLNQNGASATEATLWNSTTPTSSVFSLGTAGGANNNGSTYVAYCWAAVAGFSAFGSYTGNGSSDGPFVFTGFRPRFIMYKNSSAVASWIIQDTSRIGYNTANYNLFPNLSNAESTYNGVDILSNGFKMRNADSGFNDNGNIYIYAAFAENPFKYANAR